MKFVGIDPSLTGTGIAVIKEDYSIVTLEKLSTPSTGVERLYHLQLKFLELLSTCENEIIFTCIERAAYHETGRLWSLGQWAGVFYLDLFKKGIKFLEVSPLQLKKYVSSIGKNMGKEVVILDVFKNFQEEIRDPDLADAYVLSRIARDYHYKFELGHAEKKLKQYQIDVLDKMFKENISFKELL
jgi:crossover junction endodeoxyribonuclease RuvC